MEKLEFSFKPRHYLHFDQPLSEKAALRLVTKPEKVAAHSFYPFIGYTITTRKVKRKEGIKIKSSKSREIKIAAHADAAIYSYYSQLMSSLYESELIKRNLTDVPTAFRSSLGGQTNIDFAGEVFSYIDSHRPCVALAFDVEKFFDTLEHNYLKERWMDLLQVERLPPDHYAIFKSLTRFSWVRRDRAYKKLGISMNNPKANQRRRVCTPVEFRELIRGSGLILPNPEEAKGIPQGSPISALLSNIYMIEFDAVVMEAVESAGGLYRRYCDDIMVIVPLSKRQEVEDFVYAQIKATGMKANKDKTEYVPFGRGQGKRASKSLQYLGFTFDGADILLRQASLSRYYGKLRKGVSLAKQTQRKQNRLESAAGKPLSGMRTRKLYRQYSYLIKRRSKVLKQVERKTHGNFISYAHKAARKLDSPKIKRQVRNHWKKLQKEMRREIYDEHRGP